MSAATVSYSRRVRELLAGSLSSVEAGESQDVESLVTELVSCLNFLSENVASNASCEQDNDATSNASDDDEHVNDAALNASYDEQENDVIQVLDEISKFLSSPQMDQDVIDALSFELPKVISKLAGLSSRCLEFVEEIVDRFVEACNPRDMLSVLCEALDAARVSLSLSSSSTPLLHGLSKVFISVRRRHYEQLRVAVPVVLNVLKDMSLEPNMQVEGLFDKALGIAVSIKDVALKLEKEEGTKVRCLLGLYVMQITAVLSVSIKDKVASGVPLVMQLKPLLTFCGLTHIGLITGNDAERLLTTVSKADDDDDDFLNSFNDIKLGASLLFIWARISPEVADLANDLNELQSNPVKRWLAYGMLKYILASGDLLWEFKRHTVEVLLDIVRGVTPSQCNEQIDCSQYTTSIYAALQAVTLVIMYAPDADLRKKTFEALKRIISDIPVPQRFDVLKALVTNSQSSTMRGILLDQVKNNMSTSSLQATDCDAHVTELVELVLKPPHGGPPLFPDQSDEVLAALNLYRFALLNVLRGKETSRGGSSGFLSKKTLERDYKGWLLPLRSIVSGSIAENQRQKDHDQESSLEILCILNRIESLLYWCIELVEERLKSS
ncbi:hypothetical protein N665_0025s0289 [Sinapis alba]|nr:hypothetical protein N665_0025s0289 [Sinapis alba]